MAGRSDQEGEDDKEDDQEAKDEEYNDWEDPLEDEEEWDKDEQERREEETDKHGGLVMRRSEVYPEEAGSVKVELIVGVGMLRIRLEDAEGVRMCDV